MFVLVLGMAYRYLFHLLDSVTDMYTARKARTVSRDTDVTSGRAFVAASAGAMFGKAHALSEEVHMAMVARGYAGNARTISVVRVRLIDADVRARVCRGRGRGARHRPRVGSLNDGDVTR